MTQSPCSPQVALSPNQLWRLEVCCTEGRPTLPPDGGVPVRYRLFDRDGRAVWERRQPTEEDPPADLAVSNDGRVVLFTQGSPPEVVAFGPTGREVMRVAVVPPGGAPARRLGKRLAWELAPPPKTAADRWLEHSWPYFVGVNGAPHFVWRAAWGQRLVLNLQDRWLVRDLPAKVTGLMDRAEARGAARLFGRLLPHMEWVRMWLAGADAGPPPDPRLPRSVARVTAAAHLAGVYRVADCLPGLRAWEEVEATTEWGAGLALGDGELTDRQVYRPVVRHALRCLGQEPFGRPSFQRAAGRIELFLRHDRATLLKAVNRRWPARRVWDEIGPPDHIGRPTAATTRPPYVLAEPWEYDHLTPTGWETWRLVWHDQALATSGLAPAGTATSAARAADILDW